MANIKFRLNGCDIFFVAEAPEDITLKQLLKQCDKIKPHWCACGIRTADEDDEVEDAPEYEEEDGYTTKTHLPKYIMKESILNKMMPGMKANR